MLRARLAELTRSEPPPAMTTRPDDELDPQQSYALLQAILDNSSAVIFVKETDGRYITINQRYEALFHVTRAQIRGKTDYDYFPQVVADQNRKHDLLVIETGSAHQVEEHVPNDNEMRIYVVAKFPIYDSAGKVRAVCGIATDITDQRRAEEERAALQAQIIEGHRASLRELSTPLIPVAEGVLVMPIVGTVDSMRAAQIMDTLLEGITSNGARMAILDLTGVKVVDTQVANALMQAAQAAKLLGTEVVLTGIGPHVGMALIGLGLDFANLKTLSTLRAGVSYALRRAR